MSKFAVLVLLALCAAAMVTASEQPTISVQDNLQKGVQAANAESKLLQEERLQFASDVENDGNDNADAEKEQSEASEDEKSAESSAEDVASSDDEAEQNAEDRAAQQHLDETEQAAADYLELTQQLAGASKMTEELSQADQEEVDAQAAPLVADVAQEATAQESARNFPTLAVQKMIAAVESDDEDESKETPSYLQSKDVKDTLQKAGAAWWKVHDELFKLVYDREPTEAERYHHVEDEDFADDGEVAEQDDAEQAQLTPEEVSLEDNEEPSAETVEDSPDVVFDTDYWGRRVFRRIGRAFRRVGRAVGRAVRAVGRFAGRVVRGVVRGVKFVVRGVARVAKWTARVIGRVAKAVWNGIKWVAKGIWKILKAIVMAPLNLIRGPKNVYKVISNYLFVPNSSDCPNILLLQSLARSCQYQKKHCELLKVAAKRWPDCYARKVSKGSVFKDVQVQDAEGNTKKLSQVQDANTDEGFMTWRWWW